MDPSTSDALVFFGATGDLAYKQIFPALQALVKRHGLNIPIVGVAKAGWNLDQLKARARDSIGAHGGVDEADFGKLSALLQYVDGDYADADTYTRLRQVLGQPASAALSRDPAQYVCYGGGGSGHIGSAKARAWLWRNLSAAI